MSEVIIRRMTAADVDAVTAIEQAVFPRPWTKADFEKEMTKNVCARYLVAETEGKLVAYAGIWVVLDEGQVTKIAVLSDHRRLGIGERIFRALLQYASNLGAALVTLEVRESNAPARRLYEKCGFVNVGVRKKYYEDNGENGVIMLLEHMPDAEPDFEEAETVHEG
ncbi:MAG: ribosomal protein S18-alanine N-acetyltransferase [Clostridia bacterium]|nr:ribosomal protein S18-alanine N-acetyltransferase [Clostridia bacterium]